MLRERAIVFLLATFVMALAFRNLRQGNVEFRYLYLMFGGSVVGFAYFFSGESLRFLPALCLSTRMTIRPISTTSILTGACRGDCGCVCN